MSFFIRLTTLLACSVSVNAQVAARDPGLRGGPPRAGQALPGLTGFERLFFESGQKDFREIQSVQGKVAGASSLGLGPRFNLDSCAGCHAQPASGGTSPSVNPQVAAASRNGAANVIPAFIRIDGPVREVRFRFHPDGSRDGEVTNIFTIAGRADARGCSIEQPDFDAAAAANNLAFRIPTPLFGAGLIEAIPEAVILANKNVSLEAKRSLGIRGHENRGSGGRSIGRFGWKAQHNSLLLFTAEAYNVEQGVTNEIFPNEREQTETCLFNATPEDHTKSDALKLLTILDAAIQPAEVSSDIVKLASYARLFAAPTQAALTSSAVRGKALFESAGCALCHTPELRTGASSSAALTRKSVSLFSDLLVHRMGPALADDIMQGGAGPDEFRTAPLWGVGQRIFFLHDGRTSDLLEAIRSHASEGDSRFPASEANAVIARFEALPEESKQDILDFLRAL